MSEPSQIYYIVEALRWGERENHSYILGLYSDLERAKQAADEHTEYRGGKYQCVVHQCSMDQQMNSDWNAEVLHQTRLAFEPDEDSVRMQNMLRMIAKRS